MRAAARSASDPKAARRFAAEVALSPKLERGRPSTGEGLGKREIIRCLERYLARETYTGLP
ncbi:hypothetical protein [Amycolatopsis sp. NBC_01480]|uniref:hypothetical protein n=1 Tax=Amycolatopsis sp. NBC_01480 TaxID=2903562 RepID=UPI002E2C3531|nr:hypothetical protein [Amycolatopsis sp. NBC_01480]